MLSITMGSADLQWTTNTHSYLLQLLRPDFKVHWTGLYMTMKMLLNCITGSDVMMNHTVVSGLLHSSRWSLLSLWRLVPDWSRASCLDKWLDEDGIILLLLSLKSLSFSCS